MHFHEFILGSSWFFVNRGPYLFPCWPSQSHSAPYEVMFSVFLPLALKEWKNSFYFGPTPTHSALPRLSFSKTQKTQIATDGVYTKQSWAKNFIPESDFPPPLKTSLRFRITRGHLAGRGGRSLSNTAFEYGCLPYWVVVSGVCSMDFPVKPPAWKGPRDRTRGGHRNATALTGNLKLEQRLRWPFHDVDFGCGWNQNCLWVMTGNLLFCLVNTSDSHPGQVLPYFFRRF